MKRNQHYVPQVYLRRFCEDDKLWLYDKKNLRYWHQCPKEIVKKTHYYSLRCNDGNYSTIIEDFFSQLEGMIPAVLQQVDDRCTLTDDERLTLATFVAFQIVRVPTFRKQQESLYKRLGTMMSKVAFGTYEHAQQSLLNIGKMEFEIDDQLIDSMVEIVGSDSFSIEVSHNRIVASMFEVGKDLGKYIFGLDWRIHKIKKSAGFITSDNPLSIVEPINFPSHGPIAAGLLTPGALKVFPLGTSTCLVMGDRGNRLAYLPLIPKLVRWLNNNIFQNSERYVMARDRELLESVVKRSAKS